eukprot:4597527-Pyramimonas_sp.AAC.1
MPPPYTFRATARLERLERHAVRTRTPSLSCIVLSCVVSCVVRAATYKGRLSAAKSATTLQKRAGYSLDADWLDVLLIQPVCLHPVRFSLPSSVRLRCVALGPSVYKGVASASDVSSACSASRLEHPSRERASLASWFVHTASGFSEVQPKAARYTVYLVAVTSSSMSCGTREEDKESEEWESG